MKKIYPNAASALDGLLFDNMFIAAGGFRLFFADFILIGSADLTRLSCGHERRPFYAID